MADPVLDLEKLKAVKDWSHDLADELELRSDLLPCKSPAHLGDCISRQKRYLVEEMKPKKMCMRCQARWYVMMATKIIDLVYSAKTTRDIQAVPDFT